MQTVLFNTTTTQNSASICDACGLSGTCRSPGMKISGDGKRGIYVLGEAPGKAEDAHGYQFHELGISGSYLRGALQEFGVDPVVDCWLDNAVRCRPPSNQTPTDCQIRSCRQFVREDISRLSPTKILAIGRPAVVSLIGDRLSRIGKMERWVGRKIPDKDLNVWIYPMYHPSYLKRSQSEMLEALWLRDFKDALEHNESFPVVQYSMEVLTEEEAVRVLEDCAIGQKIVAVDFETTGSFPVSEEHEIVCVSICFEESRVFSFPMYHGSRFRQAWKKFFRRCRLVAHNVQFEDTWARSTGVIPRNWESDTALASHCFDNRTGTVGLKFLAYVHFGIVGYDSDIAQYLESDKFGINRVKEVPWWKLAEYCAKDALFSYLLNKKLPAYPRFFTEGAVELCRLSPIQLDVTRVDRAKKEVSEKILKVSSEIQDDKNVQNWEKTVGKKFNPMSHPNLSDFFFQFLKTPVLETTKTGNPSCNLAFLEQSKNSVARKIRQLRYYTQLRSTFLDGFLKNSYKGQLFPDFPLVFVKSFRGSCQNPNFQNVPKRNEEAQQLCRQNIRPSPTRVLMCVDYDKIEVRMAACNTRDPELVREVTDPEADMHRDLAARLFLLPRDSVSPQIRYLGKNGFVFPEFYGSSASMIAPVLWKKSQKLVLNAFTVREHLETRKVTFPKFLRHVQDVENWFWSEKFVVYSKWKDEIWNRYVQDGFLDLPTGFRCTAVMERNDVINYPNQSSAFHCLLWSLTKLNKLARESGWKSRIIGEIHDEIVWDAVPEELPEIIPVVTKIMCEDVRNHWSFITVPLKIDIKVSQVDGDWAAMQKYEGTTLC